MAKADVVVPATLRLAVHALRAAEFAALGLFLPLAALVVVIVLGLAQLSPLGVAVALALPLLAALFAIPFYLWNSLRAVRQEIRLYEVDGVGPTVFRLVTGLAWFGLVVAVMFFRGPDPAGLAVAVVAAAGGVASFTALAALLTPQSSRHLRQNFDRASR